MILITKNACTLDGVFHTEISDTYLRNIKSVTIRSVVIHLPEHGHRANLNLQLDPLVPHSRTDHVLTHRIHLVATDVYDYTASSVTYPSTAQAVLDTNPDLFIDLSYSQNVLKYPASGAQPAALGDVVHTVSGRAGVQLASSYQPASNIILTSLGNGRAVAQAGNWASMTGTMSVTSKPKVITFVYQAPTAGTEMRILTLGSDFVKRVGGFFAYEEAGVKYISNVPSIGGQLVQISLNPTNFFFKVESLTTSSTWESTVDV